MKKRLKDILEGLADLRIAIIGDLILDKYLFGMIERLNPDEVGVPILRLGNQELENTRNILGGAGNVANNIIEFSECDFYGVVGNDETGKDIRRLLSEKKIRDYLEEDLEIRTIVKTRLLNQEGHHVCRTDYEELFPQDISSDLQKKIVEEIKKNGPYDAIVLSDYNKGILVVNSEGESLAKKLIEYGNSEEIPTIVDFKPDNVNYFKGSTVCCPNRKEAKEMLGVKTLDSDLRNTGKKLQEMVDSKYVIVTCDKEGVFVYNNGDSKMMSSYAREVSDHTGAGDSFTAGVALGLADGLDIYESAELGNMIAGIVVEKKGTATTNYSEMIERYSKE